MIHTQSYVKYVIIDKDIINRMFELAKRKLLRDKCLFCWQSTYSAAASFDQLSFWCSDVTSSIDCCDKKVPTSGQMLLFLKSSPS